ncbi:MAG: HNH endonuclease [Firmicutes bacterium]|nr:HNH endonuclease [Bacillota bacterium]MCL1953941.1 HNH endonuclease [Bacillota bacterium]
MAKSLNIKVWDKLYPKQLEIKLDGNTIRKDAVKRADSIKGWDIQKIDSKKADTDISNYKIIALKPKIQSNNVVVASKSNNNSTQNKTQNVSNAKKQVNSQKKSTNSTNNIKLDTLVNNTHQDKIPEIWFRVFGDNDTGRDFCGRVVNRDTVGGYRDWDIDHIVPIAEGGTNDKTNLQITSKITNKEKANKLIFFTNGKLYQVKNNKKDKIANNQFYDYGHCDYCVVEI